MIKKLLLGLAALIALAVASVLGIATTKPDDFRIERSALIAASAQALFEQVNDVHKFDAWNPWAKVDPNVKNTYSGPASGVGACCSWDGNNEIGAGSSTIIESKPGELVRQRMDYKRPMEGTNTVDFTFKSEGDKTRVTWAMYGPQPFKGKIVSVFFDCEKICGPQFEQGLKNLEAIVTAAPAAK